MSHTKTSSGGHSEGRLIDEILGDSETRRAFAELVRCGMDQEVLADELRFIPRLPNENAPLISQMTYQGAWKFPERVERLAKKIEEVNKRSALLYDILLDAEIQRRSPDLGRKLGGAGLKATLFKGLPGLLRAYAHYLRAAMRLIGKDRLTAQRFAILALLAKVQARTGRPHWNDVATLLDAAFLAASKPTPIGFSEDNLRRFCATHRERFQALLRTVQSPHSLPL
jgi:hypothetical protein